MNAKLKIGILTLSGIIAGLAAYTLYASRAWAYLSDQPSACVNCHIMAPYYATWSHSSHGRDVTCSDCHIPHDNPARKWYFKSTDGIKHAAAFTLRKEPQVIQAKPGSDNIIRQNCIRCHTQLNTEFVKTGRTEAPAKMADESTRCWHCHRNIPHQGANSLSATPSAIIPYPRSNNYK
jgi:cytochrome c nitrite reductase small subunit